MSEENAKKSAGRLEPGVVLALLKEVLGDDAKISTGAAELAAEYLRLVTKEAIDRSVKAAEAATSTSSDNAFMEQLMDSADTEVVHVESSHVGDVAQSIFLDL